MINIAVEGESDREVARAVATYAGHEVHQIRVAGGKNKLDPLIPKYNVAAAQLPWVVFRDSDSQCPKLLRARLTAGISSWHPQFCLRIAHSMSEAWLLADRDGFAEYFRVPVSQIPRDPESLPNAKQALLALCGRSRSTVIRKDVTASGARTGPLYVIRINEFASTAWNVAEAELVSQSLRRAVIGSVGFLPAERRSTRGSGSRSESHSTSSDPLRSGLRRRGRIVGIAGRQRNGFTWMGIAPCPGPPHAGRRWTPRWKFTSRSPHSVNATLMAWPAHD